MSVQILTGDCRELLLAAAHMQRHGIGIEFDPAYAEIGRQRYLDDAPLFQEVAQ